MVGYGGRGDGVRGPNYRYNISGFTSGKLTEKQVCDLLVCMVELGFVMPTIEPPQSIKTLEMVWSTVMKKTKKKGKGRKC